VWGYCGFPLFRQPAVRSCLIPNIQRFHRATSGKSTSSQRQSERHSQAKVRCNPLGNRLHLHHRTSRSLHAHGRPRTTQPGNRLSKRPSDLHYRHHIPRSLHLQGSNQPAPDHHRIEQPVRLMCTRRCRLSSRRRKLRRLHGQSRRRPEPSRRC
jgi:hypothetical protein